MTKTMSKELHRKIRLLLAMGFLASSGLVFVTTLFRISLDGWFYRPNGLRLIFSAIAWQRQIIPYPFLLRAAVAGIFLGLSAAAGLAVLRKVKLAALAGCTVSVLAILSLLLAGGMTPSFKALNAGEVLITATPSLILLIVLPFLAAVLMLWSQGGEELAQAVFLTSAAVAVGAVATITLYMLITGIPAIIEIGPLDFLFGSIWKPTNATNPQFGILPMMLATLAGTAGAVALGVPIGLLTAIFLAEIAPPRIAALVRPAIELLAGIPSVIYGFFGLQLLVPLVQKVFGLPTGASLFSAIIILAIMILPTIVNTAETGLRSVPAMYREASLALGATRIETIFKVLIPAARSSILSGVILGVGRAIGETMAVIMVAGNVPNLPALFGPVRPMTVGIALEMSYAAGLHQRALFAIGLILFLFIMLVNWSFSWLSKKGVQMSGTNE